MAVVEGLRIACLFLRKVAGHAEGKNVLVVHAKKGRAPMGSAHGQDLLARQKKIYALFADKFLCWPFRLFSF